MNNTFDDEQLSLPVLLYGQALNESATTGPKMQTIPYISKCPSMS